MFKSNIRMWTKFDLSDFHCGMIVGAKMAGWSVSETVNVLGFSSTMVSGVYLKWCIKRKTSSEQQFCGQKHFVDDRVQRRKTRLVWALQPWGKKSISEITTCQTLRQVDRNSRRPCLVLHLSSRDKNLQLQWEEIQQNWTVKDWKNRRLVWWNRISAVDADGRVRVWHQRH